MVLIRRGVLALLAVAASAGCTRGPVPQDRATSRPPESSSAAPTARSTADVPSPASTSPARTAVSSSAARAVRPIPPVSIKAHAAGLIDIRSIVPTAVIDLRYATSDNFVGVPLYPANARCLVHESMAAGLAVAANRLRSGGEVLVFWDCYRPHAVQVHMFQIVPDPNWVARPGPFATSHEAARSVDVTLARAATDLACPPAERVQRHCLLDMGTAFDDFSPRANAFATYGVSPQAQANRARLRRAMNAGGITVYDGEWWHFDGPGAGVRRPHLEAPVN